MLFFCVWLTVLFCCAYGYTFSFGKSAKYDSIELYDKADDLYKEGRYDQALKGYAQFLQEHPQSTLTVAAKFYTAECYRKKGNTEKALNYYEGLINEYKKGFWIDNAKERIAEIKTNK